MSETRVEMIESENSHWYKSSEGKYFPSVTTILSIYPRGYGFDKYLADSSSWESSQEILRAAGKRGTNVHQASELLEQGRILQRDSYTLEEWEMLMGYVNWRGNFPRGLLHSELPIISNKLKTGGTIDRIFSDQDDYEILDIKTSGAIHNNYWIQVAVYAEMYEQKYKIKIAHVSILRLSPRRKDGYEYKNKTRTEWKDLIKIFKATQSIWNHLNPNATPRILEIPTTLSL